MQQNCVTGVRQSNQKQSVSPWKKWSKMVVWARGRAMHILQSKNKLKAGEKQLCRALLHTLVSQN
jgi:hypothetical protein